MQSTPRALLCQATVCGRSQHHAVLHRGTLVVRLCVRLCVQLCVCSVCVLCVCVCGLYWVGSVTGGLGPSQIADIKTAAELCVRVL